MGGEGSDHVSIKATPATQADLIDLDPETFRPAAYVGRYGWVTADLTRIEDGLLRTLTHRGMALTAPRRLANLFDAVPGRGRRRKPCGIIRGLGPVAQWQSS